MATMKLEPLVGHRNRLVLPKRQAAHRELVSQATLIDGFEQAGSELAMDLDGARDHLFNQRILDEGHRVTRCKDNTSGVARPRVRAFKRD